jgi:hypothetical protein
MKTQLKFEINETLPDFDQSKAGRKWLSYFDLLAWSKFCENADLKTVFKVYQFVLRKLDEIAKGWPKIRRAWASDTFVFYACDDSPDAFQTIEHISRWFEALMLKEEIPIRGALACDDFYTDEASRVFLGNAIVEAHKYAEGQDWIGFILTPSAERRALELSLLPSEFYRPWPVCMKVAPGMETLQSCILDSHQFSPAVGDVMRALKRMERRVKETNVKLKYTRAIKFLSSRPNRL